MTWDPKYTCEYTDILGLDWKWDFEFDGSFTPITLQASGGAQPIEFLSQGEDLTDNPIKGSKADLTIETLSDFQWEDLCPNQDQYIRCSIYAGVNLFWRGYVIPDNLSEPYNMPRYSVVISASDGLGLLKTIPYDDDGTPYNGRMVESQIIIDILAKIGFAGFTEYVNIYETRMDSAVGDSPIDQTAIDVDVFADMNCYEVLEQLLKKHNAIIRQKDGEFIIYRPKELTGLTVYGRVFTAATEKSATSFYPDQYISRPGLVTDIRDIEGGTLMRKSGAKEIRITQDYGSKASWIDNWELMANSYDSVVGCFESWTPSVAWTHITLTGQDAGVVMQGSAIPLDPAGATISQVFAPNTLVTTDVFIFSFDYFIYNNSGGVIDIQLVLDIKCNTSTDSLEVVDDEYYDWGTSTNIVHVIADAPEGESGWISVSRKIIGIPTAGAYKITIWRPTGSALPFFVSYKNLKFYCTSDELMGLTKPWYKKQKSYFFDTLLGITRATSIGYIKSIEDIIERIYTATTAIEAKELDFDCILGDVTNVNIDNVIEQLSGSLAVAEITAYTDAVDKVDTAVFHAAAGSGTVSCNGYSHPIVWVTTVTDTLDAFILLWSGGYGSIALTRTAFDTITFSGSSDFTACNVSASFGSASTTTAYFIGNPVWGGDYTTTWNTRGGAENTQLLQIICNEIRDQYARTRQLLNIPILENNKTGTGIHINLIGNFQDGYNEVIGSNRIFAFNRGLFNTIDREWDLNLVEIVYSGYLESSPLLSENDIPILTENDEYILI
jgi:hypothetical protein